MITSSSSADSAHTHAFLFSSSERERERENAAVDVGRFILVKRTMVFSSCNNSLYYYEHNCTSTRISHYEYRCC